MRKIKFRIWDKRFKTFYYPISNRYHLQTDADGGLFYETGVDSRENYILQQCTDLKDKNGKEIYEGDILQALENNESVKVLGVCKQVLGGWRVFPYPDEPVCWGGWKQEIVGNIFET